MQLVYRAQAFLFIPAPQKFLRPRAVNWRYQVAGEVVEPVGVSVAFRSSLPATINWRYQLPVMA